MYELEETVPETREEQSQRHDASVRPAVSEDGPRKARGRKPLEEVPALVAAVDRKLDAISGQVEALEGQITALVSRLALGLAEREYYSTAEAAKLLGRRAYTVREWCRLGRVQAEKRASGRGPALDWVLSRAEVLRIQHEGLLPLNRD